MSDRDPETYQIIGAAMDVHRELGSGYLEAVYQEALAIEFSERDIPFQREASLAITYKQHELSTRYKADFVCFGQIIVEIKAARSLTDIDQAQVLNYLKTTSFEKSLLINFGEPSLRYRRLVRH